MTMALQSRWADLATEQPQGNPVRQEQQPSKHKYAISFWNSRFTKSLLPSFPFLSDLGTSLLPSHVKNVVIGNGRMWFLYSKQRLLTQHIREFLQVWPGPLPNFWAGSGDEAKVHVHVHAAISFIPRPYNWAQNCGLWTKLYCYSGGMTSQSIKQCSNNKWQQKLTTFPKVVVWTTTGRSYKLNEVLGVQILR